MRCSSCEPFQLRRTTEELRADVEVISEKLRAERDALKDLEDSLSTSREQQVRAAVDVQDKVKELRDLRIKIGDYETQLCVREIFIVA